MSGPVVLVLRLLVTALLYIFLAWGFFSLWQDIRTQSALLSGRKIPPLTLRFQDGNQTNQTHRFTQPEVMIGRDPACECQVEDEAISAHHARLSYHHNQWWLEDMGSTNGTWLNQERLTMPTVIVSGDEFRCGGISFAITSMGEGGV